MTASRCRCCGRFFRPDPRKRGGASKQRTCGRRACRKTQQRRKYQDWIRRNPGYGKTRRLKVRGWAKAYPDYWRGYRRKNRSYAQRDNERRRKAKRAALRAAKQTVIREILVEKLLTVKARGPGKAAKQTVIDRRVDALVDVLVWEARSAKQSLIGAGACPGG